jgi:hypothetical protein
MPSRNKLHETLRPQYQQDEIDLPNVIIPANGDYEDFYATVATYYQAFSPISAISHVLSEETRELVHQRPQGKEPGRRYRSVCLGIAVGEAALAGVNANDSVATPTYSACRRTLAFSVCRTRLLYGAGISADSVARRWMELRKLTGLPSSAQTTHAVLAASACASPDPSNTEFAFMDQELAARLRAIATGQDDGDAIVAALGRLYPETKNLINAFDGPFDGRMSAFTKLIQALQVTSRGTHTDEIAVAFFCNLIQPGSFAHAGVLAALADFYPAALVWYGFFCGVANQTTQHGMDRGLITKLDRDLVASFNFDRRPECDISLEELKVLSRLKLRQESIKPSYQRAILVAILPGVNVLTRFGSEIEPPSVDSSRLLREQERANWRISKLLEEALHLLKNPALGNQSITRGSRAGANRRKSSDK